MTIDTNELRKLTQSATPGPWKILPVGDGRQKFAVADRKSLSILTVTDEGGATFGTVYDDADAKFIAATNPAAISEILDRLEAAEKEVESLRQGIAFQDDVVALAVERDALRADKATLQQMTYSLKDRLEVAEFARRDDYQNWMTALDRNAELLAKLETAEKERDVLRDRRALESQENGALRDSVDRACEERDELRAESDTRKALIDTLRAENAKLHSRIAEMERQEPIGYMPLATKAALEAGGTGVVWNGRDRGAADEPIYALPGAQNVPDGWKSVPDKHPTFDPVDLLLADGSVLCDCLPQSDGDYWWKGPSGEVFIDPRYAPVTHWRLSATPEDKP